VTKLTELIQ